MLPSVFVSHGAPTMILEASPVRDFLAGYGRDLDRRYGRPKAVLAVSAHWETPAPALTLAEKPTTIHDFYGFPAPLYELQYPAPGAPELARRAAELLSGAGFEVALDPDRGLDHGAWVPLMLMYPQADIPVTQLSLQTHLGAQHHYRLGEALRPLREAGVLVFASGGITHNLREFRRFDRDAAPPPYVSKFAEWVFERAQARDAAALLDYRNQAPNAGRNHPTEEHFLPFYVALGTGTPDGSLSRAHASHTYGVLRMDAYEFC